jgi:pimeloyl-ACP methyl ester carboxylesterase
LSIHQLIDCGTGIYERVQTLAKTSNVRFVAITRRGYKGSTPYSEAELKVMNGGPEEEKSAFMVNRGVDILTFIDKFLTEKNVPLEPAKNGNPGGVAIIGWSMGNSETNAAIANFAALAPDAQARLAPLIHTLILHGQSEYP